MNTRNPLTALLLAVTMLPACAAYKLKTPPGFASVSNDELMAHYKASDNVGLNVRVFGNVDGGTLAFWGEDLVRKLETRQYSLTGQTPVESRNGIPGTRFEFAYAPGGEQEEDKKFFSVTLFATDEYRVVVQLAGAAAQRASHAADVESVLAGIKVRGCDVLSKICRSAQPRSLVAKN